MLRPPVFSRWIALVAVLAIGGSVAAQCVPGWSQSFEFPSPTPTGIGSFPSCVFDDGTGPALYFANLRWNGVAWSVFIPPVNGISVSVTALAVYDDGTGPALHVGFNAPITLGGVVLPHVGRWKGSTWSALGSGTSGIVKALGVFDDGTGPALYAGGSFLVAGGAPVGHVARWNGTAWSDVGGGVSSGGPYTQVESLAALDDGTGPSLYATGYFSSAGGAPASNVARWNGTTWSALGGGTNGAVSHACAFDDGAGPEIYVTGGFTVAGAVAANNVARWNGSAWSALGAGLGPAPSAGGRVLSVWDDGQGPALFVGGYFATAGGVPASSVARYLGGAWSSPGGGLLAATSQASQANVYGLQPYDDGTGLALHALGDIGSSVTGSPARWCARWNGAAWSALPGNGVDRYTTAFVTADLGDGPALYAGGFFNAAGGVAAANVARWSGRTWSALGAGIPAGLVVNAIAAFDDGTGPALYAGGVINAGGLTNILRWNGAAWVQVGGGITGLGLTIPGVQTLAVFDDGTGPKLYAGGDFTLAGGAPAYNLAKWNGTAWSSAGGIPGAIVHALLVGDVGNGPELFAGGEIASSAYGFVGRWAGSSWQTLGVTAGPTNGAVRSLAIGNDGSGPALYAGGRFQSVNGVPASVIAKWNGFWTGVGPPGTGFADALAWYDDGTGSALYALGTPLTNLPLMTLARRTGGTWTPLGGDLGVTYPVTTLFYVVKHALHVHDDGSGPALFAGADFKSAGGVASSGIAKWGPPNPKIEMTQPGGPGSGVVVNDASLLKGHEYYNIFSDSLCGAVGTGPYLGLCAPDTSLILFQFSLPLGAVPFHFNASVVGPAFGTYQVPPGLALDALCFDFTGGQLGCFSKVTRFVVQ